jgi:DNA polymerase-1
MQGTAADIIKRAMIAVDEWLRSEKPRVRMIMQVHDELVFEVHKDELDAVSKKIHELMETALRWRCRCWWKWVVAKTGIKRTKYKAQRDFL